MISPVYTLRKGCFVVVIHVRLVLIGIITQKNTTFAQQSKADVIYRISQLSFWVSMSILSFLEPSKMQRQCYMICAYIQSDRLDVHMHSFIDVQCAFRMKTENENKTSKCEI